jgi:DNA-directed RNA polymerase subunit K/omega
MADDESIGMSDMGDLEDNIEEAEEGQEEHTNEPEQREVAKESRALNFLNMHHPECRLDYLEQTLAKLPVSSYPPDHGSDRNHRSVPYLTPFEKTKIIGFRANQLAQGGRPFVSVPSHMTDVLEIARLELEQKRLPYIVKRPMPDGTFEYIRISDLLMV